MLCMQRSTCCAALLVPVLIRSSLQSRQTVTGALTIWYVLVGDVISSLQVYAICKVLQFWPGAVKAQVLYSIVWFGLYHSVLRQASL